MRCRDGNSTDAEYLAINSGYVLPPNITSSGNQMLASFFSSHHEGYRGYYAIIHENPHYCEQWLDWYARTIRSPTFPEKKSKSRSCVWLLRANKGYTIRVTVVHFQVGLIMVLNSLIIIYYQRVHQYILNGTSTRPQSSSKNVLVTNPPVLFGIFFVLVSPPVHQSKTYVDKHVAKWGGTIFLGGQFSKNFWGVENFSYPLFSEF